MATQSEWDYWPGLEEDIPSFYTDDPSTVAFSGVAPASYRPPPGKRRRVGNMDGPELPSPHLNPTFSNAFSSPQMASWPSPQLGSTNVPFFSPKLIGGSPSGHPAQPPYPQDIPPMTLSDISRLPPIDPAAGMQPPYPYAYLSRPAELDPFDRTPYTDPHGRPLLAEEAPILLSETSAFPDPRMGIYDAKQVNPYEELKGQMLMSLAYEVQNPDPRDLSNPAYQLDVNLLSTILEARDTWEAEEGSALSALTIKVLTANGTAKAPKPKENLSRAERLARLEDAMCEVNYMVERVLNPLNELVNGRDMFLQQQYQYFRQLIKQIGELQPHYNDLSMNFETLCQHLQRRVGRANMAEKRDDDKL